MATDVNQPEVAVLMAVCNGRQWLPAQVDSILGQSGVDISLYLSIDPSKDESELYCRQLAESSDRVILLSGSGPGNAAANFFRLIRHVDINRYDYIALADQDDIWLDDKLRYAIQRLNEEKADGFSSSVEAFWPNGKRRLVRKDYPQRKWDYLFESPGPGCTFVLNSRLSGALRSNLTEPGR